MHNSSINNFLIIFINILLDVKAFYFNYFGKLVIKSPSKKGLLNLSFLERADKMRTKFLLKTKHCGPCIKFTTRPRRMLMHPGAHSKFQGTKAVAPMSLV